MTQKDSTHQIKLDLKNAVTLSKEKATMFFKTNKGEYGEKDKFIGITVPNLRKICKKYDDLCFHDLQKLIESDINEERLFVIFILVNKYNKSNLEIKDKIFEFYIHNLKYINNWNLVDASAHLIVGSHLWEKEKYLLIKLAESENLWERRISIVATLYFIRKNSLEWTFKIAEMLILDKHDLIHKATGWMLRETGKKDVKKLIKFLDEFSQKMPRTMLRYAIEKLSESQRKKFLIKSKVILFKRNKKTDKNYVKPYS